MDRLSVYAREVEASPGSSLWVVFQQDGSRLRRVGPVSDWLRAARVGVSPNTLARRARSVAVWWRWCVATGVDPLLPSSVTFSDYVMALQSVPKGEPLWSNIAALPGDDRLRSAATVKMRVQDVKLFYEWASEQGTLVPVTNANQMVMFKSPSACSGGRAPRLEPEQVQAMQAADIHPRDRMFVDLAHCAGLRAGEALGLHVEDVHQMREVAEVFDCGQWDRLGPHLHVRQRHGLPNRARAKGREHAHTPRVVPMSRRLVRTFGQWQWWIAEHLSEAVYSRFVLVKLTGPNRARPWDYNSMYERWTEHISRKPGLEGAWPHLLRHTFASELADAGVDRAVIQGLLGHRSPESTDIYTHPLASTMEDAVKKLTTWRTSVIGEQ